MVARIRILVDGKLALTTAQFAAEHGINSLDTARAELRRLGLKPVDHLDARTPLYPATESRKAWKARPGRGANLRRPKGTEGT